MIRASFIIYLFILIFAPLAFGAHDLWAKTIVETACFLSLFLYLCALQRRKTPFYVLPGLVPLFLFVLWHLLQVILLPAGFVHIISPQTLEIYQEALNNVDLLPISLTPYLTIKSFFKFAAFLSFYILTIQLLSDPKRLQRAVMVVLGVGTLMAVQAILQKLTDPSHIYWFRSTHQGLPFGPFYSRNHFAGFMEMLLPLSLSLFLYYRPHIHYKQSLRVIIVDVFNHPATNKHIMYGFSTVAIAIAILFSESRGGIICAALSCLLLFMLGRKRIRISSRTVFVLLIGVLFIVLGSGQTVLQNVNERFGEVLQEKKIYLNGRTPIWRKSFGIARDFTITGTGFGTFSEIYPSYNDLHKQQRVTRHAHNDYLETLTDGGIIAVILIGVFLFKHLTKSYKYFRQRRDRYALHLFLGSFCGIIALLLHCIAEYHFNHTAVALYFFFLLGFCTIVVHSCRHRDKGTLMPVIKFRTSKRFLWIFLLFVTGTVGFIFHCGEMAADWSVREQKNILLSAESDKAILERSLQEQLQAVRYNPLSSLNYFFSATIAGYLQKDDLAAENFYSMLLCNPVNAINLQQFAFFLTKKGDIAKAEHLLQTAIKRSIKSAERYQMYGYWLLGQQRDQDALVQFKKEIELSSINAKKEIMVLSDAGLSMEEILKILPDRVQPHLEYGNFLIEKENFTEAGQAFLAALSFLRNEKNIHSKYFTIPYRFFMKQEKYSEAFGVLQQGIEMLPDMSNLYLHLGDFYKHQGMKYKAIDSYRQVLNLNPGDKIAEKRLIIINRE